MLHLKYENKHVERLYMNIYFIYSGFGYIFLSFSLFCDSDSIKRKHNNMSNFAYVVSDHLICMSKNIWK